MRFLVRLIAKPLVVMASRRLVKGRSALESSDPVPINADVAHVPVHKAHHVRSIVELVWLFAVVGAEPAGPGKLAHQHDAGRPAHGGNRLLRHARLWFVRGLAVEPIARITRHLLPVEALPLNMLEQEQVADKAVIAIEIVRRAGEQLVIGAETPSR